MIYSITEFVATIPEPLSASCVPGLELNAALGAQLVHSISKGLEDELFTNPEVFAWTDSTVTLAWIKKTLRCEDPKSSPSR